MFEKQGLLYTLEYVMLNDMINGMLFKSFNEVIKSEKAKRIAFNLTNNKFLNNFKLYLAELRRDINKVYSVIEICLYRVEKRIEKLDSSSSKPDSFNLKALTVSKLYDRLLQVNSYA